MSTHETALEQAREWLDENEERCQFGDSCIRCVVSHALIAADAELRRLREALALIDGECEHIHGGKRCIDLPQWRDGAEFWAERTCNSCVAHRALSGTPEDATASRLVERMEDYRDLDALCQPTPEPASEGVGNA